MANYIDNAKFLQELVDFKKVRAEYKARNDPNEEPPRIPEYIGECFLQLATRIAKKPNFAGYAFRDDMVSDAVENMLLYMHNFSEEKSKNPFGYFTQIIYYAFFRRIEREKKHIYTKLKYAMHLSAMGDDHVIGENGDAVEIKPAWMSYTNVQDFIRDFESKVDGKIKKPRSKKLGVIDDTDIVSLDMDDTNFLAENGEDEAETN